MLTCFNIELFDVKNIMGTHYKGTVGEVEALNAYIKFTRAAVSLDSRINQIIKSYKLTGSQFGALEVLHHLGPMCAGEIGEKLLKSSGNMTMVVDNLEKRGFVRRERDTHDRRQVIVHLTQPGTELIGEIFPRHVRVIAEEMNILTPGEQKELGRLCKILGQQTRDP